MILEVFSNLHDSMILPLDLSELGDSPDPLLGRTATMGLDSKLMPSCAGRPLPVPGEGWHCTEGSGAGWEAPLSAVHM